MGITHSHTTTLPPFSLSGGGGGAVLDKLRVYQTHFMQLMKYASDMSEARTHARTLARIGAQIAALESGAPEQFVALDAVLGPQLPIHEDKRKDKRKHKEKRKDKKYKRKRDEYEYKPEYKPEPEPGYGYGYGYTSDSKAVKALRQTQDLKRLPIRQPSAARVASMSVSDRKALDHIIGERLLGDTYDVRQNGARLWLASLISTRNRACITGNICDFYVDAAPPIVMLKKFFYAYIATAWEPYKVEAARIRAQFGSIDELAAFIGKDADPHTFLHDMVVTELLNLDKYGLRPAFNLWLGRISDCLEHPGPGPAQYHDLRRLLFSSNCKRLGIFITCPDHIFSAIVYIKRRIGKPPSLKRVVLMNTLSIANAPNSNQIDWIAFVLVEFFPHQSLPNIRSRIEQVLQNTTYYIQDAEVCGMCTLWASYFLQQVLALNKHPDRVMQKVLDMSPDERIHLMTDLERTINTYIEKLKN